MITWRHHTAAAAWRLRFRQKSLRRRSGYTNWSTRKGDQEAPEGLEGPPGLSATGVGVGVARRERGAWGRGGVRRGVARRELRLHPAQAPQGGNRPHLGVLPRPPNKYLTFQTYLGAGSKTRVPHLPRGLIGLIGFGGWELERAPA